MTRVSFLLMLVVPLAGCGTISAIFEGSGEPDGAPPMTEGGYAEATPLEQGSDVQPGATTSPVPTARSAQSATEACEGGFTLGRQAYIDSSAGLGHECNAGRTNCRDGYFLELDDGGCYCVLSCSSLVDDRDGAPCTDDGSWTCQHVQATNSSTNHARICAPAAWNLCQAG